MASTPGPGNISMGTPTAMTAAPGDGLGCACQARCGSGSIALIANGIAATVDERGMQRLVIHLPDALAERGRHEGLRSSLGRSGGAARRVNGGHVDDGMFRERHELLLMRSAHGAARVIVVRDGPSSHVPLSVGYRVASAAGPRMPTLSPTRNEFATCITQCSSRSVCSTAL